MGKSMSKSILYIGSQSQPRQELLRFADISFEVLRHNSSECVVDPMDDFERYVIAIACDKMKCLELPKPFSVKDDNIFVLTADTLIKTVETDQILGKPRDLEHAKAMLKSIQNQSVFVLTGCCLQVMKKTEQAWALEEQKKWATGAFVEFFVDDQSMDFYFKQEPWALRACGAGVIEGFGQSFLKSINGSYTAVLGLPLFELRHALTELGFNF
jgi:septum formation protein